jgi:hypothetical protein
LDGAGHTKEDDAPTTHAETASTTGLARTLTTSNTTPLILRIRAVHTQILICGILLLQLHTETKYQGRVSTSTSPFSVFNPPLLSPLLFPMATHQNRPFTGQRRPSRLRLSSQDMHGDRGPGAGADGYTMRSAVENTSSSQSPCPEYILPPGRDSPANHPKSG